MSLLDSIRQACTVAWKTRGEEGDLTFDDLFPDEYTPEELARLWLTVDSYRTAVNQVARIVGDEWVRVKQELGRGIEVDGVLVTTDKGYWSEKCVDPNEFWDWVGGHNAAFVRLLFNENNVLVGALPPEIRKQWFRREKKFKPDSVEQAVGIPTEFLNDR